MAQAYPEGDSVNLNVFWKLIRRSKFGTGTKT